MKSELKNIKGRGSKCDSFAIHLYVHCNCYSKTLNLIAVFATKKKKVMYQTVLPIDNAVISHVWYPWHNSFMSASTERKNL